ncbi:MAG: sulfatase-like hydrolase/transferase [Gemmatimonadetes bacterium]|nr:sulfatase-like hydrolase/transferase [Gemmatimonadota bacterium]
MHDSYRHATNRRLVPALFALLALACGKPNPDGPHLLILTIDTLRQDALGAFGSHTARTPHLDRLAAEGSTLANAQTAAPTTLPSHATMFTGYYPATHGARHNGRPLAQSHVTLAELLRERGYDTAAFVASMVLHRSYGLDQGFDEYDDAWSGTGSATVGLHGQLERRASAVTESFASWYSARGNRDDAWFAWVHYYDPHAPYEPVTPFAGSEKSAYAAEVSDCDRSFGSIRAMLERSGDWENTIVIVLSDHGEGLGEHSESEHGLHVYETTIAIPWIVKVPAAIGPAETIVPWPVETVDLVPTVLQWLAPRHEQNFAGRSFRSLLAGEAGDDERPLYAESYYGAYGYDWAPLHALRIGDWKLVSGVYDELFSLQDSPPETLDRAGTDAAERNRLARRLDVVRRTWKETAPDQGTDSPSLDAAQRSALEALGYVTAKSSGNRETRPDTRAVYPAHELIMAGRAHFLAGDLGSAASKFQRALSIDPDNVDALVRLADCYRLQGEPAREESVTVRILELDPAHAASWSNLGLLVEKKLDLDRAYECYENAIAADSNFFHAYANRANLRIVKKDLAGAEADYRAALALNDAYAEAHLGLARVAHARGDWAEVVRELRVTIRLNPEDRRAVDWLRAIEEAHARGEIDITGA